MMAKGLKQKNAADLLAGILVLIVALGLVVAVVFAVKQFTAGIAVPTTPSGTPPITAPSTTVTTPPPDPTLAPNPLTPEGFAYDENGYLTCLTAESWLGVDVSVHQGQIDWDQVAQSQVQFAMIRLAYRGWGSEGLIRADARGLENLQGAKEAGLKVGVYFFSQATSAEEAVEEARFLLDMLDGQELDMPIVFDWENVAEEEARTNNVDKKTLNACAQAFCKEIEAAGYDAMVYFYLSLAQWKLDLLALQQAGYDFWLALYSDKLSFRYQVQMWQYSNAGNVPGINTKVDLNLYFPGD